MTNSVLNVNTASTILNRNVAIIDNTLTPITATAAAKMTGMKVSEVMTVLVAKGIAVLNCAYDASNSSDEAYDTVKHMAADNAWLKGFNMKNVGFTARPDVWIKTLVGADTGTVEVFNNSGSI